MQNTLSESELEGCAAGGIKEQNGTEEPNEQLELEKMLDEARTEIDAGSTLTMDEVKRRLNF